MKTRVLVYIVAKTLCMMFCVRFVQAQDKSDVQVLKKVVIECLRDDVLYTCLADRAARAVERAINWDIPVFEGITYKRNEEQLRNSMGRSSTGLGRLTFALSNFIEAHTLTLDLGEVRALTDADGESKDGGGGKRRVGKKERRYVAYALMVLMGVFGLTTPIILKTLAVIAGKALIASKIALIMLGSVALKKIFQADHDSGVKVHTHTIPIHEDDHDRYMDATAYNFVKGL